VVFFLFTDVHKMHLKDAKDLAKRLEAMNLNTTEKQKTGSAMVIDTKSFVASAQAARRFADAGLTTATHFTMSQPNNYQCGHNCAGWACLLCALGNGFMQLTTNAIEAINNAGYAKIQNA
jgi:hypothetical protein